MLFGWLSSRVGARLRPSLRRRTAPLAQESLAAEIDADALTVRRVWLRELVCDPAGDAQPEPTVIALIEPGPRSEVVDWLEAAIPTDATPAVRTDWLFFPATPEAVLIGVVEGDRPFRFNLRLGADRYRRQLTALVDTGQLGLTTLPLQIGPALESLSPCRFVPIKSWPLRDFLRDLPPVPVV